jgi:hypothetical protein
VYFGNPQSLCGPENASFLNYNPHLCRSVSRTSAKSWSTGTKQNGFPVPFSLFMFDLEGCGKTKMNSLNSGARFSSTSLMGDAHK